MWHAKEPQWPWVPSISQNLNPASVMVMSPNEWKILEWDVEPQTKSKSRETDP